MCRAANLLIKSVIFKPTRSVLTTPARSCYQQGFTLIELISVMVVLSIVAALGSQFLVTSVDSYREAQIRSRLLAKGRTSIEQITRYLRASVPNSVRVSASGNCVEAMPAIGGAFYLGQVADSANNALSISSVATSPFFLDVGTAQHAVIASLFASEVYSFSSPAARVSINSVSGSPITQINFSLPHRFIRNSLSNRVYVAGNPKRFCVVGGVLTLYEGYGLVTTALTDANPGGSDALMATEVAAGGTAFALTTGTENRNAALTISLVFSEADVQVPLNQSVLIRNVP